MGFYKLWCHFNCVLNVVYDCADENCSVAGDSDEGGKLGEDMSECLGMVWTSVEQ